MFHVKICGVTTPDDARLAAAAGADAIGLNFVAGSARRVELAAGRAVAEAVPAGVLRVGVFAGASAEEICRTVDAVGIDAVQLHGQLGGESAVVDPPGVVAALGGLPVIRAVRLEADGLATARRWLAAARDQGGTVAMALVDASVPRGAAGAGLGGTGARVDWEALVAAGPLGIPLALAGGLGPDNVAEAIRVTRVTAVDTASGVEAAPGRKDPRAVQAFVAAARRALGLA